jgi:uncharacterized protein YbjT (DUF2867 family)
MGKMKTLVIGATGMLAGPVIRQLDQAGFDLRLFSRTLNPSMFVKDYDIVQGDLCDPSDLEKAVDGCDAIHISISNTDEVKATEAILNIARQKGIRLISMVSGASVSEENRWFSFIDQKFRAEQMLMQSGIPYYIFRPTWFFESLELMVRKGKASILGQQQNPYHWVAADDFGRVVANAYLRKELENRIYYVYGPDKALMMEMLERYCEVFHPEIKMSQLFRYPYSSLSPSFLGIDH